MRRYIIQGLCGWLVLLAACTAEEERIPIDGDGGSIALTARKEHLITKAGDEVKARQPLGDVFSDGANGGRTVLHFQLRREKQKLNPEQWLAL